MQKLYNCCQAVNDQLASDFPMIPYMFDIINTVKTLMKLFIKADVVDSCS